MGCNYFRNWKANKARDFAKYKNFSYSHNNGDDEIWVNKKLDASFRIPSRNETMLITTLMDMIRKSKVPKKEWKEWGKNN